MNKITPIMILDGEKKSVEVLRLFIPSRVHKARKLDLACVVVILSILFRRRR